MHLVLNRDFGSAALLGHLVAVTCHVTVLTTWETSAAFRERTARLAIWAELLRAASLTAVVEVGAEGAVTTDRAWSVTLP